MISHKPQTTNLLTIGELANQVGMRPSALRYYESQGLLAPAGRTEAGYRLYDPSALQTIQFIQRAQRLGFSLKDIAALIQGWQASNLEDSQIIQLVENRYLALEKQLTQALVLQREMGLLLQDINRQQNNQQNRPSKILLNKLLDRTCSNPLDRPSAEMFEWLLDRTGCTLSTEEGKKILAKLKGQHAHIWQEEDTYYILVISKDPAVEEALHALAALEENCHLHNRNQQPPSLNHNDEGFLFISKGENAFFYARLFMHLENA